MAKNKKIRTLVRLLERAGFETRPGKGSHRKHFHPALARPIVTCGALGDDASPYQERRVERALHTATGRPCG